MPDHYIFEEHKGLLVGKLMGARYERENKSPPGLAVPPALLITDEIGAVWSIGTEYVLKDGRYFWNVIRNDVDVDEMAERLFWTGDNLVIFTPEGRKTLSRSRRSFI